MTTMLDRMMEATRLVREGRTARATDVIRGAVGAGEGTPDAPPEGVARGRVEIDGEALPPGKGSSGTRASQPEARRTTAAPKAQAAPPRPGRSAARPGRAGIARTLDGALKGLGRKPLGTASILARAKRGGSLAPTVAPGARYEWRTHRGPHGSRRYRLYVPAARPTRAMPLVMMLHGCTQDADDFAAGTRILEAAERHGLVVVLPEQPREANAMGCWNWFERGHQSPTAGEPAILGAIIDEVGAGERIDRARILAAGLSAGGAMAATLGATRPDLMAGIGVHSGLPHGAAHDTASAFAAMGSGGRAGKPWPDGPRLFVVQGDADTTVAPANADALTGSVDGRSDTRREQGILVTDRIGSDGRVRARAWRVPGLAHAWSGGAKGASYTAPNMPDATAGMLEFLLAGR